MTVLVTTGGRYKGMKVLRGLGSELGFGVIASARPTRFARRARSGHGVASGRLGEARGQALIEFAFVAPVLLLFILLLVDLGIAMDRRELIQHAVREGARRAAVGATVAEVKDAATRQSGGTLDPNHVDVCYWDTNGSGTADAGDKVQVSGDYAYKFSVGAAEWLSSLGIGQPSIQMSPSVKERLEKSGLSAPVCTS